MLEPRISDTVLITTIPAGDDGPITSPAIVTAVYRESKTINCRVFEDGSGMPLWLTAIRTEYSRKPGEGAYWHWPPPRREDSAIAPQGSEGRLMPRKGPEVLAEKTFRQELRDLLNHHNAEAGSQTPDYVLAQFLADILEAFGKAMEGRTKHGLERPMGSTTAP